MKKKIVVENIVESTLTIPFFSASIVDTIGFVNQHKDVAWTIAFSALANAQNENALEMRTKSFVHGGLKHPFSQVEGDLNL